jgi:hypothetical protein
LARVTFINAIMSGSVGGTTYSSNKGGAVARVRVTPTNRRTGAQVRRRQQLGSVAATWNSLLPANRLAWESYATNLYVPKHGRRPGVAYAGFNAFSGCNNLLIAGQGYIGTLVITSGIAPVTNTDTDFTVDLGPSLNQVSGQIIGSGEGQVANQTVSDLSITSMAGPSYQPLNVVFKVNYSQPISLTAGNLSDAGSNNEIGYIVMCSRKLANINAAVRNKDMFLIGTTGVINFTAGTGDTSSLGFSLTAPDELFSNSIKLPVNGDAIEVSVWELDTGGQQKELLRQRLTIG